MGHKESVKDTARVLSRMYDAIEYRGFGEKVADELAEWSDVPVDGPTDEWHPTQILADFLTIREHVPKPLEDVAFCYLGDARFNMADTYLVGGAEARKGRSQSQRPRSCGRRASSSRSAREIADDTGARITITDDVAEAVRGCDVLFTDVWVSMGEPDEVLAAADRAAEAV